MLNSSCIPTGQARRSASEIAPLLAHAMRQSGNERCCITNGTLQELIGGGYLSRAIRRPISHEAQQPGFAFAMFAG